MKRGGEAAPRSASSRPGNSTGPRQRGVALVLVLWVLVLLTTIAMSFVTTTRMETALTANVRGERESRALVDAGIQFQILQLLRNDGADGENTWPADGVFRDWSFAGRTIQVRAVPESGWIDLNAAGADLLTGLMRAIGLDEADATALANRILDWRDRDGEVRPDGAEEREYEAAGYPYGPRNGRFETVDELQQVLGINRRIYRAAAPALTVLSRRRTVDPTYAPPLVLEALPGVDPESAEESQVTRSEERAPPDTPLRPGVRARRYLSIGRGVYRVQAKVGSPGGGHVEGTVVMTRSSQGRGGYKVLESRYNPSDLVDSGAAPQPAQVE